MRLGTTLPLAPGPDGELDGAHFGRVAAELESLGYASIWTFDAVGRGFVLPDPLTILSVAAAATTTIELGTGVLQLPWRSMPELAGRVFTTHLLSGGRLVLGVGPGSTEHDFVAMGAAFDQRFSAFATKLAELRSILDSGSANGRDLAVWPTAAGGPSIMIGAWRGPWVTRAATEFGGWIASAAHNDDAILADAIGRFRDAGGGRAVVTNVQAHEELGPAIERLLHLRQLGFDDAVLYDLHHTPDRAAEAIAALA